MEISDTFTKKENINADYFEHHAHDLGFKDLRLLYCGYHACEGGHKYGPGMRNHFLYHFVVSGKGMYSSNGHFFEVEAGEGFISFPDTIIFYEAKAEDPWKYIWVAFEGDIVRSLFDIAYISPDSPLVIHQNPEAILALLEKILDNVSDHDPVRLLTGYGLLMEFTACVIEDSRLTAVNADDKYESKQDIIQKAIRYMKEKYMNNIDAQSIAEFIGVSRSYFQRLFKKQYSRSPMHFLCIYRMSIAWHMLMTTTHTITEVAELTGYTDPAYFSRIFRKVYGIMPSMVRKSRIEIAEMFGVENSRKLEQKR